MDMRQLSSAALVFLAATGLPAQSAVTSPASPPSVARTFAGALLGGAAGTLAGGVAGAYIGGNRCSSPGNSDTCQLIEGILVGSTVGFAIGTPVGAHLLNRRRGSLAASLIVSGAIATAGIVAVRAADRQQRNGLVRGIIVAVPIAQLVTTTAIEVKSSR
jgi:cyanophycinase-like exopeptidase